jgi:cell division protein ZapA
MAQVIITINHREYPISCENGEEGNIIRLGNLLDEKAQSLINALGPINENMLLAMTGLILADELNDLKKNTSAPSSASVAPVINSVTQTEPAVTEKDLDDLDTALADNINSLNEAIKSVALKLKSV